MVFFRIVCRVLPDKISSVVSRLLVPRLISQSTIEELEDIFKKVNFV